MRYLATIGVFLVLAGLSLNASAYDRPQLICKQRGTGIEQIFIDKCPDGWIFNGWANR